MPSGIGAHCSTEAGFHASNPQNLIPRTLNTTTHYAKKLKKLG